MSREKQIEELTNELIFTNNYGTHNAVAKYLYEKGYRKQSEVIRCKDCRFFFPYTEDDKADGNDVERTDGICCMRVANSDNKQFCACEYDDFCSFAKMKGGAE